MWKRVMLALSMVALSVPAAQADQGRSQGRGRSGSGSGGESGGVSVSAAFTFTTGDHDTFRAYFSTHKITATALPPGIAKNLERGKPLPPGIAKKALPADLVRTLGPRAQSGLSFAIFGDRVVALRSGLVVDVMVGVFR